MLSCLIADERTSLKAQMWVYRSQSIPLVVYEFDMNRTHAAAHSFLLNDQFQGVVIADCRSGYTTLETKTGGSIRHASRHAHARRKFIEARESRKELAEKILGIYQILYDLEDESRHASAEIRAAKRNGPMREVWNRLKEELQSGPYQKLLPKEPLKKAIEYIFNNEAHFEIRLSDQAVPLDNNTCERAMKHVALARKNWLFLGSPRAGIETAGLMTLVHSAIREFREVEHRDRAEHREMIRSEKREARRRKFRQ